MLLFIEGHLASEAFAVLLLDYHILPQTDLGGLAVDFESDDWDHFQNVNPKLGHYGSKDFNHQLINLYLTGDKRVLNPKSAREDKKYQDWFGHEERYSRKQRYYVMVWYEDLTMAKKSKSEAALEETFISEAVWDLIHMFISADEKTWRNFLEEMASGKSKKENLFQSFKKYKNSESKKTMAFDFRFTDFSALPKRDLMKSLKEGEKPSSSQLFLFWQILSTYPPTLFKKKDLGAIRNLALSSQTLKPDQESWINTQKIVEKLVKGMSWKRDSENLATFFLP